MKRECLLMADLVNFLCKELSISKKKVAKNIGVSESSVQKGMGASIEFALKTKAGKRICYYYYVVMTLRNKGFTSNSICNGLVEPCINNPLLNEKESILEVIQQGKEVDLVMLAILAEDGIEGYMSKVSDVATVEAGKMILRATNHPHYSKRDN
ncbi:hypothetical protein [Halobacteriovorax sp. ZH2_bin.1]|uniref:hypothetical protein n=1 Tax=unclassified Halobacteriovorax TaxID=2639665 RepID=UPI0037198B0C